jgi:aldose 1-epimerase
MHTVGERIEQMKNNPNHSPGYDHCYVLKAQDGKMNLAARVKDPKSGRVMEVLTTQPAVQVYSGNNLAGTDKEAGHKQYDGLCLETQHYPDSPNHKEFPSVILRPGQTYHETTIYRFSTE